MRPSATTTASARPATSVVASIWNHTANSGTKLDQIRETYKRKKNMQDLRTAAFVVALDKISGDYVRLGIFPYPVNKLLTLLNISFRHGGGS